MTSLLVTAIRETLELKEDFDAIQFYVVNAFNKVMQKATIEAFLGELTLQHMASLMAMTTAPESALNRAASIYLAMGKVSHRETHWQVLCLLS